MQILKTQPLDISNETIMSYHFKNYAISNPEVLPQVARLFGNKESVLTSLLAAKGLTSGDLYSSAAKQHYKVVGNRKVVWQLEGENERVGTIVSASCDMYSSEMGKNQSIISLVIDTNWFSPREVLMLADGSTLVYNVDEFVPEEVPGGWLYHVKVQTNDNGTYVDAGLLAEGMQISAIFNLYEEMSETAYEKYTFHHKSSTNLSIMRMKWSVSGTAEAINPGKVWIEHNGAVSWMTHAQYTMLSRWARYRENHTLFSKSTVTANDEIILKTEGGFDIMAGDGILNQGDGAFRIPTNKLTKNTLEKAMSNLSIYSNAVDGSQEVVVICGKAWKREFNRIVKLEGGLDPKTVEISGAGKGVVNTYDFYEIDGVRIIPRVYDWFDMPGRAHAIGADGERNDSHRAIFISIGDVKLGRPNVQLLSLGGRQYIEGEVNGINKGGMMANSVDAKSHHILSESGVAVMDMNGIMEMYRPFSA